MYEELDQWWKVCVHVHFTLANATRKESLVLAKRIRKPFSDPSDTAQRDYPIASPKSHMAPQDKLPVSLMPVGPKVVGIIVKDREIPPEDSGQSKHAFFQDEKVLYEVLKINTHFSFTFGVYVNFFTLQWKIVKKQERRKRTPTLDYRRFVLELNAIFDVI